MAPGAARWPELICAPSKAGTGGRGAGEHALRVAQQDLGIGADIDDERQFGLRAGGLGQRDGGGVGAHMARDAGQEVDARGGRDPGEVEIPRVERDAVGGGERERAPGPVPPGRCRAAGGASPGCRR
jgi:hypothetical protein